jgi:hypothetical protein
MKFWGRGGGLLTRIRNFNASDFKENVTSDSLNGEWVLNSTLENGASLEVIVCALLPTLLLLVFYMW